MRFGREDKRKAFPEYGEKGKRSGGADGQGECKNGMPLQGGVFCKRRPLASPAKTLDRKKGTHCLQYRKVCAFYKIYKTVHRASEIRLVLSETDIVVIKIGQPIGKQMGEVGERKASRRGEAVRMVAEF